ncbi:cAMP responsive element modulator b isoform X1 [Megalobrama amblycephala]|uniref:cAMP responsive element modulator b isoform X1 n=1 Tax=Megalobrama amblycephala TaxID=75352 RepID=UPI00201422E3|nr:cAMP responsive element modulator b isoform X1 [Megalobrama amblycephala]
MDAGGASQPITQSAEDAQASSVICKEETNSRDLPDSSTSAHLGDCLKDEDAEKKFDAEASSRNLFSNNNAGPFISVNQSGSVQFIPSQQRYETFSSWPGSPIMQYAVRSRNGTYIVSDIKGQATPGGMSAYQISSPASGLSQVMDSSPSSLPSPQKLAEEASRKRELRLMKNRTAAKEYRRRQKDYVRSLETRIAMMENQKRKMTEELDSLKELCTGKSHSF